MIFDLCTSSDNTFYLYKVSQKISQTGFIVKNGTQFPYSYLQKGISMSKKCRQCCYSCSLHIV